ncbi:hypothetical protein [Enterocloster sp.]|uniref:hypothetical protein n=1 Tax=Enterocloster sp. TaxID=2719315 RepID=UPI00399F1167
MTLRLLKENGETDEAFPAIPYIRTEQVLKKGDVVAVGLLYGQCRPYILGRCLILTETDLMLDDTGQPVPWHRERSTGGRPGLFLQDIRLEALTMEGNVFDSDYGWSLLDFCPEIGELEELR